MTSRSRPGITKVYAQSVVKRIEKERKIISEARDRLRALTEEADALIDSSERADEGLEMAISALSEYA